MKSKESKESGRPSAYRAEFVDFARKYLDSCQDVYVNGKLEVHLPSVEGFSTFIGVSRDTLYEWAKKHEDFSDTLAKVKQRQHERLVNSGLSGLYNASIVKLMLCSNHGYSEKRETAHKCGKKIEEFLDEMYDDDDEDGE